MKISYQRNAKDLRKENGIERVKKSHLNVF